MTRQPYWTSRDGRHVLYLGDCLDVLPGLEPGSVDSIVCDPPYGLSFMGKGWDHGVPGVEFWGEVLHVVKPGAHLLAFGGTRTYHRLACAIEDAGWEIRDCVMWVYGSGFPKSLDVSKAIDATIMHGGSNTKRLKKTNETRPGEVRTRQATNNNGICGTGRSSGKVTNDNPATFEAAQWSGWGTALKPAWEPIIVARKPLVGNVAANVLQHGTGALNIDGCRIGETVETWPASRSYSRQDTGAPSKGTQDAGTAPPGRWPANLIHDGSDEVVGLFPERDGMQRAVLRRGATTGTSIGGQGRYGEAAPHDVCAGYGDTGSAARFFYCAKASRADREEGNDHPTVKPTALMRYLCRLVTPPGGKILDPFCGSGSTGKAAIPEGFQFIGIEREPKYADIAVRRMERELSQPHLPGLAPHEAGDVVRELFGE